MLNAAQTEAEATIVSEAGVQGRITVATNMAGRGTDIKISKSVAAMGGLYVVATEPATGYRVDRQLFGRAARQGDPGCAQLFASADDELLVRHAPLIRRLWRSLGYRRDHPREPVGPRVRPAGGGRKPLAESDPGLAEAVDALVDPATRGDPKSPLRWTRKSTARPAEELTRRHHPVSDRTVATLLKGARYSLHGGRDAEEPRGRADRQVAAEQIPRPAGAGRRAGANATAHQAAAAEIQVPPEVQEEAVTMVLRRAESLADSWSAHAAPRA